MQGPPVALHCAALHVSWSFSALSQHRATQGKNPWGDSACADCPGFLVSGAADARLPSFVQEPQSAAGLVLASWPLRANFLDLLSPALLPLCNTHSTSFCNTRGTHRATPTKKGPVAPGGVADPEVLHASRVYQKTREGRGCPKFVAGKVFRQISTLLENCSLIFRQLELLFLPRFGHSPARKILLENRHRLRERCLIFASETATTFLSSPECSSYTCKRRATLCNYGKP